jgi:predicted nucleic acid-binding protein
MLVIDASICAAWVFPDERTEQVEGVLARVVADGAIVPAIWSLEIANTLLVGERRGRLTSEQVRRGVELYAQLPLTVDVPSRQTDFGSVMPLAKLRGLTSYDASYLELALRTASELATLDERLRAAAVAAGVSIAGV